jgi:hypothetical protein
MTQVCLKLLYCKSLILIRIIEAWGKYSIKGVKVDLNKKI